MGTAVEGQIRCPVCNRFGSNETDGFCKLCYRNKADGFMAQEEFYVAIHDIMERSSRVATNAMMEVGADEPRKVKPADRKRVITICRQRLPRLKSRHIVREKNNYENKKFYTGDRYRSRDKFGLIGKSYGYQREKDSTGSVE